MFRTESTWLWVLGDKVAEMEQWLVYDGSKLGYQERKTTFGVLGSPVLRTEERVHSKIILSFGIDVVLTET